MANERLHIDVACALIEREGRVLAALRPPGKHMAGRWEFPGGKLRAGETSWQALEREIHEELDCVIGAGRELHAVRFQYPDVAVTLWPWVCCLARGTPRALEHMEIRWVLPSELRALDWADADAPIVEDYLALVGA